GGLANSWDYGPLGAELKNTIKQEWWRRFVQARTDMVGVDTALLMNTKVWEASGHLKEFSDPLVECKKCHERFRADHVDTEGACPSCGTKKSFTKATQFNLMLKTFLGPAEEKANVVYFRPETAQGMFVNFKNILETTRRRLPFGIAQMGKAFRNEITPGNFIFRTREFEQMEIEYFVRPEEWEEWFEHWLSEMRRWLKDLGVRKEMIEEVDIPEGERAHYSKRTVDIEYKYPFGQKELYGLAYRGDFDLTNHTEASGEDLCYTDPETKEKFLPHVIEPTWGVDRSVLVAMLEAYREEKAPTAEEGESETRIVMKFPKWLAPVKVAVLPLSKKEELSSVARTLHAKLAEHFVCEYDETQSIGKRYRREDEIGTPYCVTVDFETKDDGKVTVRDRDTMAQERVDSADLVDYLKGKLAE
ncbi:MAG: glycine--tRNA ligase, partial [Candidatus Liptonbacteria bacterium]|nr:glycine--tRNA ligase [Candidatus Liptonbacteria bacterium]